jgi:hypothetical protein
MSDTALREATKCCAMCHMVRGYYIIKEMRPRGNQGHELAKMTRGPPPKQKNLEKKYCFQIGFMSRQAILKRYRSSRKLLGNIYDRKCFLFLASKTYT